MLDICIPIHVPNMDQVITCLEAIKSNTRETPFKVILDVDGGEAQDSEPLRQYLATSGLQRTLTRSLWGHSYSSSVRQCFSMCKNRFVAVVPPHIELTDPAWFGKLHRVFQQDKMGMLAGVDHEMPIRNGMPPIVLGNRGKFVSDLFLTTLRVVKAMPEFQAGDDTFSQEMSDRVRTLGGHTWIVPGVKMVRHEHVAHAV